jgi:DNA-binding transcriptional ArsR family regulator
MRSSTKKEPSVAQLDLVFQALSDGTRRNMLGRLVRGPARVTELAQPYRMSLPAASKHIRVLERARLIHRTIDGRNHLCSLSPRPLRDAEAWLRKYQQFWEQTVEALARYVEGDRQ